MALNVALERDRTNTYFVKILVVKGEVAQVDEGAEAGVDEEVPGVEAAGLRGVPVEGMGLHRLVAHVRRRQDVEVHRQMAGVYHA